MMFEFRKPCRNKKRDHRQGGDPNCVGIPSCRQPLMYVWFNWPILRHVTWRWIYAACFISTIPSLCHVHLVVLDTLLTGSGIDVDAIMPAAHSFADHYGLASVTSHSCCPIFSFIANDQMAAVGAIYLSRAPLRVFLLRGFSLRAVSVPADFGLRISGPVFSSAGSSSILPRSHSDHIPSIRLFPPGKDCG